MLEANHTLLLRGRYSAIEFSARSTNLDTYVEVLNLSAPSGPLLAIQKQLTVSVPTVMNSIKS